MSDASAQRTPGPMEDPHWRRNARALAAGNLLVNVGWTGAFAFLPLIVQSVGVKRDLELWVGAMMFGYFAVSCVFTPVWGVLADYYGRKSMVLRAGFGMGAGFALLSVASDPRAFLFVLILTGLANGFVPASQALVATTTPRNQVGGALALTQAGASTGTLFGPLVGAALIGVLPNMSLLFSFTAAAMFAAGVLSMALVREDHVKPAHALRLELRADVRRLWIVPELKLLYYLQVLFAFTVFGAAAVVSMYTMQLLGDRTSFAGFGVESWVAITAMGFTLFGIVMLPFWGRALDRYPPERVLGVLLAGTCITSLLAPLVRNPLELALARVLFALFVSGLLPVVIRMIRDRSPQGMEARTLSYGTAIQQIGSATAPLVAGVLAPYVGLEGFFWLASALLVLGWILWLRRKAG
ncbi:MAG: MFS transporter [Burkholderiales bacterium]|nr:MFS transporter [Burkholderiales bacterium]